MELLLSDTALTGGGLYLVGDALTGVLYLVAGDSLTVEYTGRGNDTVSNFGTTLARQIKTREPLVRVVPLF